ncbi:Archaeal putative transposase ISC1217 [Metallosphaera yellowstonensis MK1]|uniref:Archaeal putative transposase ISC1217 n=1 Tax=Metallosphaera yellowstonensis MK1 TaxID=671065 RepID=H2C3K9_9CREN|nr:Archaeal putative transposase ISC1217 [Metallosphaera yellowstonensis MK1]
MTLGHRPGASTPPTSRSARRRSRRPVGWEIEELHRDVKALGLEDSSFWRRERLKGYLTIFTIMTNVVGELVVELNLRSVEAFLRLSNVI